MSRHLPAPVRSRETLRDRWHLCAIDGTACRGIGSHPEVGVGTPSRPEPLGRPTSSRAALSVTLSDS
jgi:hypothetical protein